MSYKITPNMEWIVERFNDYVAQEGSKDAYLRGLHYFIVTLPEDQRKMPTGHIYQNTKAEYIGLSRYMKKIRIMEVLPFDCIFDNKNVAINKTIEERKRPNIRYVNCVTNTDYELSIESMYNFEEYVDNIYLSIQPAEFYSQTHRLCLIIEKAKAKSSLEELCKKYGVDNIMFSGQASVTRLYEIGKLAKDEGKPLHIFYLSDLDVAGWFMPDAVEKNISEIFSNQNNITTRVCLLKEQAQELGLPPSFDPDMKGYKPALIKRYKEESGTDLCIELDGVPAPILIEYVENAFKQHAYLEKDKELTTEFTEKYDGHLEELDFNSHEEDYDVLLDVWKDIEKDFSTFESDISDRIEKAKAHLNLFEKTIKKRVYDDLSAKGDRKWNYKIEEE